MPDPVLSDLPPRLGLLGDAHADTRFLQAGLHALAERAVSVVIQLGDFGILWNGSEQDGHDLALLNTALRLTGQTLLVVTGNHDSYQEIADYPPDADGVRRLGRVWILPRSGRAQAAGRPLGWLSGAASVNRSRLRPGISWWPEELPTPAEAAALSEGGPVEVVLAHDALDSQALTIRLARTAESSAPTDLAYADAGRAQFSRTVLGVLADEGLVISGHYHFRMSVDEIVTRPDGRPVRARNEILSCQFEGASVAILDVRTRSLEAFVLDERRIGQDRQAFRSLLKRIPDGPRQLQNHWRLSRRELEQLRNGVLLAPPALLDELRSWLPDDARKA